MPGSWVRSLPSLIQSSVFPQLSPTWPVPTPCSLTMRLVCVTGLGSISCNPLFGYLGSGYLPLWDRGAQRDYAPCPRPQNLEHWGQDRNLGFWFKIQCSSHKPGTFHLLSLRSHGSVSQSNPILFVWTPSWSSLSWSRSFKEGRFYHFVSSFFTNQRNTGSWFEKPNSTKMLIKIHQSLMPQALGLSHYHFPREQCKITWSVFANMFLHIPK